MDGPEHYRQAEKALAHARKSLDAVRSGEQEPRDGMYEGLRLALAAGQIHATLALTAATAPPEWIQTDFAEYPDRPTPAETV